MTEAATAPDSATGVRVLVTGFEPFGDDSENASAAAVRRLAQSADALPEAVEIVVGELPVEFGRAVEVLHGLIERHSPDAVVAVGEAGGRSVVTPERCARNERRGRIADNAGHQPGGEPILPGGPETRWAGVDLGAVLKAIVGVGVPARVSDDAGRFVCNEVAYAVNALAVPGVFIHVPALRSQGRAGVGAETDDPARRVADPDAEAEAVELTVDDLARALAAAAVAVADRRDRGGPQEAAD